MRFVTTPSALAALLLLWGAGCRDGESHYFDGGPDADADVDADVDADADTDADAETDAADDADEDGATEGCSSCDPAEACIEVNVTRAADDSMQPWVLWPTEADGVGTLVVTATDPSSDVIARATAAGVDVTDEDALVVVELCADPSASRLVIFLDDDEDADESTVWSADYLDSCLASPREVAISPAAGELLVVDAVLNNSCD